MQQFTNQEIGRINSAMRMAITRAMRMHGKVQADTDDLLQDAWLKVCIGFDRLRAESAASTQAKTGSNLKSKAYILKCNEAIAKNASLAPSTVSGFAYRVAYRVALDYVRRAYKLQWTNLDGDIGEDDGMTMHDVIPDAGSDFVGAMQHAAHDQSVVQAMDSLKPHERTAILVALDDSRALTGAERIAKMRGLKKVKAALAA